jgi:hypothetical protein
MPHLNAKLNASFGFLVLPLLATKTSAVFGKIVVVEESLVFTAADEYSRYIWRHSVSYLRNVCLWECCGLTIRVLGDSSTALIPS